MEKLLKFTETGRVPLRDYYLRYVITETVTGQGDACEHCQLIGNKVEANIYATDFDGQPLHEESCLSCVLATVDRTMDADPSFTITVEVADL